MITELLVLAHITRKLWKKNTPIHRTSAVAIWIVAAIVLPLFVRFLEGILPTAVLIAMPFTTVSIFTVKTIISRRRNTTPAAEIA